MRTFWSADRTVGPCLQTGDKDFWSDPKGSFLAALVTGPLYLLLGKQGLDYGLDASAESPVLHTIVYKCTPADMARSRPMWDQFLAFIAVMHCKQKKSGRRCTAV